MLELGAILLLFPLLNRDFDSNHLIRLIFLLGVILLFSIFLRFLAERFISVGQNEIEFEERRILLESIVKAPWKKISRVAQSDLNTALMSEISQAVAGFTATTYFISNSLILLVILAGTTFANFLSTLFVFFLVIISFNLSRKIRKNQLLVQNQLADSYEVLNKESSLLMSNLKFLRGSGFSHDWLKLTLDKLNLIRQLTLKGLFIIQKSKLFSDSIGIIALVCVLLYFSIETKSIVTGVVYLAVFYRANPRIQAVQSNFNIMVQQSVWSERWQNRVLRLKDFEPKSNAPRRRILESSEQSLETPLPLIELNSVNLEFPDRESLALKNVTLKIFPGEKIALTGPSGSGKSTLIDVITGLLEPDSGIVKFRGIPIEDIAVETWQRTIALVPQSSPLKLDTLRENLAWLNPDITEEDIGKVLSVVGLDELVSSISGGIMAELKSNYELSGGQIQRIAIARALCRNPNLLLLDESTSSLDEVLEDKILAQIIPLQIAVIACTHNSQSLRRFNRVIRIEDGSIVFDGDPILYRVKFGESIVNAT